MSQYVKKIRTESGDLQIDYNALANLPTISNPNLLINGDFQVWQRGESFSGYENAYCADRWNIRNANHPTHLIEKSSDVPSNCYMQNSIHIVENYDGNTYLQYHFEQPLRGTYTLSFWYKSTAVFNSYIVDNGSFSHLGTLTAASSWTKVVYTFTASSLSRINLIQSLNTGECYITGVKLEIGTRATEFVPRLYAEELAMCQRYSYVFAPCDHYTLAYHIFKSSENSLNFSVQLPTTMRATPSLRVLGGGVSVVYNDDYGLVYGSTGIQMNTANAQTAKVKAQYGVTFPTDTPVEFFAYSSLTLLFDAEIY